jgi:hypothetical protein
MTIDRLQLTTQRIAPHHPHYWRSRPLAFEAIRQLERAIKDAKGAPLYTCSGYDEDGAPRDIVENLAPFERIERAKAAVRSNPNAMSTLQAQKKTHLLDC